MGKRQKIDNSQEGRRSLDSEFQQCPGAFALTPASRPARDDRAAGCTIVMSKRKKPEIVSNDSTGRKALWCLMSDVWRLTIYYLSSFVYHLSSIIYPYLPQKAMKSVTAPSTRRGTAPVM